MPKHFHEIAPVAAEHEEIPGVRIALQALLHLEREAIHAAAHVGMTGRNPHAHARGNGYHRRGSAFITAVTRSGSTAPEIRKRTFRLNSSSMSGVGTGNAAGGGSLCSAPAIVIGAKPIAVVGGAVHFNASRYCLRQPNSMLRLMLCRRATALTVCPSTNVSATRARFSSSLQCRRAWPKIISTLPPHATSLMDPSL